MSGLQDEFIPEPITEKERRRDAESEALIRKITEDDPGYWDRLADRIIAEAETEGGSIAMEELLGMDPASEAAFLRAPDFSAPRIVFSTAPFQPTGRQSIKANYVRNTR
jgi:hypothetical protein